MVLNMSRLAIVLVILGAHVGDAQPSTALPADLRRWTLSAAPVLTIGTEGDTNTEFLRIAGVTRMPSGEIVVANGGSAELRVFSPEGRFLRSLSRRGQGPGELTNFSGIIRAHDTLFVTEFAPGATRLHIFTLGEGFRTRSPLRPGNAPKGAMPIAWLSSGEFLVSTGQIRVVNPVAGLVTRDTMALGVLHGGAAGEVRWIGDFPNNSWLGYASPSLPSGMGFTRFTLGPSLVTGASADRIWIGDAGTGDITIRDAGGRTVAKAGMPVRPRAFSTAALERAKRSALTSASTPDLTARYENLYDRSRRPRTAPVFTRFIAGTDGQMGVELFEEEGPRVPRSIAILDRDGEVVARLTIPANVVVHEIGTDYVLGIQTDDDGVERVVQFRLIR